MLAGNGYLCSEKLVMPTTIVAQNGRELDPQTNISVSGCPSTNARKLTSSLASCRKTDRGHHKKLLSCEAEARKRYGAKASSKSAGATPASGIAASVDANALPPATSGSGSAAAPAGAPAATPADGGGECPNEAIRKESDINPSTNEPYSLGLPECRAYEMVSPVEKQGGNAADGDPRHPAEGLLVSPGGGAAEWSSTGAFSEPDGWAVFALLHIPYGSERSASGWETTEAFPPTALVEEPEPFGLSSDFSPDLLSGQTSCGEPRGGGYACAVRERGHAWIGAAGPYRGIENETISEGESYKGASADLSRLFVQPRGMRLLSSDSLTGYGQNGGSTDSGIYEVRGAGGSSPQVPRLVNVITNSKDEQLAELLRNKGTEAPVIGGAGSSYQAISQDGRRVFFTAEPPSGGPEAIYARESKESGERETIELSAQECKGEPTCDSSSAASAQYDGASADGAKVFFTTQQQLLGGPSDGTPKLYEYDFSKPSAGVSAHLPTGAHLIELSVGGAHGAKVDGVVRTSADGSHVYLVAEGVLTSKPNSFSQHAEEGKDNLYAVDTETGAVQFVAELVGGERDDGPLWEASTSEAIRGEAEAQSTPDGRYLVFSTYAHLAPNDTNDAQAVYRYAFETEQLVWLSQPAEGLPGHEGDSAEVASLPAVTLGSYADIDDWNRAISGCSQEISEGCEAPGQHDGEDVIFTTKEQLNRDDTNGATDVYLWHCSSTCANPGAEATVTLISDGHSAKGVDLTLKFEPSWPAMSESGRDVFFFTETALVPSDSDTLVDLYDARINGGFATPAPPAACSGEGCQVAPSPIPTFGSPGSEAFSGG